MGIVQISTLMVVSDYEVDFDDFAAFSEETQVKRPNLL